MPPNLLLLGAGGIVGLRVGVSLAAGALVAYGVLLPHFVDMGLVRVFDGPAAAFSAFAADAAQGHWIAVKTPDALGAVFRAKWALWPGAALIVGANLTSVLLRAGTFARGLAGLFRKRGASDGTSAAEQRRGLDPLDGAPSPRTLGLGLGLSAAMCVALQTIFFDIPVWAGLASIALAALLSAVCARATGLTDLPPVGPLGKVAQLTFSFILPGNMTANLMVANASTGAAAHASELLTDVKTGHVLGVAARKQLVAQLFGVAAGSFVCVPAYLAIAATGQLGSSELPAPAAASWRAMAEFLARGAQVLPPYAAIASAIAGGLGVAMAVVEDLAPKLRPFLPSATGLGIAFLIDGQDSFAIFLGALLAWAIGRRSESGKEFALWSASGLLVGEGIVGVAMALLRAGGIVVSRPPTPARLAWPPRPSAVPRRIEGFPVGPEPAMRGADALAGA